MTRAYVALLVIDLHFPEAASLKDKRSELRSVRAVLQGKLGAAVAEVDHQDRHQRATLSCALTSGSLAALAAATDSVERWLEGRFPQGVGLRRHVASLEDLES